MSNQTLMTRRGLFMKLGILFNGLVGAALAVPIVQYLLSAVTQARADGYLSWVSLGALSEFPEGELIVLVAKWRTKARTCCGRKRS